jgi:serine phosphatase RsbU (regulator of sigma subunit)
MSDNILSEIFDSKLVDEILKCDIVEVPKDTQLRYIGEEINTIPVVLSGAVRVFRNDFKGGEIPIYDIAAGESCIISIDSTFKNYKFPAIGVSKTKAKIALVPKEKSFKWFEEFSDWRKFILDLYSKRLNELVKALDISAKQQNEIKEKNESITKSIEYAKRIQSAALFSEDILNENNIDHFIFFQPRDIVSGDFYWINKSNDRLIVIAADATGHGVPGAFMSMLGIAFLNEIIELDINNISPNEILSKLREKVKTTLKQSGKISETKDGMDMAVCILEQNTLQLHYSGANIPIYLIKNHPKELIEIKPTRQPVGIYPKEKSFVNHSVQLEKGDIIYLFSDGFVDQFGGSKNMKYKHKNFKKLLLLNSDKEMTEQKNIIKNEFNTWKKSAQQIDDVLVIGIKAG